MMSGEDRDIKSRKRDHLRFFKQPIPTNENGSWLSCVRFVHRALPELDMSDIDCGISFLDHTLRAPLMITGMTGGTNEAMAINLALASAAKRHGIAFGLGSCRAMLEDEGVTKTYDVRPVAADIFLAANLGGVQVVQYPLKRILAMVRRLKADAICIHLNPAQELIQPEGDRGFQGVLHAIKLLAMEAKMPVIVKEVGQGIAREDALALASAGVRAIDIAGFGGTSWPSIEAKRRKDKNHENIQALADWGIPTAAAILEAKEAKVPLIASGGIRNGLDIARGIVLGADIAGVAAPVLQAYYKAGAAGVDRFIGETVETLKRVMLLTGSETLLDLKSAKHVLTGELATWAKARNLG